MLFVHGITGNFIAEPEKESPVMRMIVFRHTMYKWKMAGCWLRNPLEPNVDTGLTRLPFNADDFHPVVVDA